MLAFVLITSAASAAVLPQNGTTMCCQWRQRHTPAATGGCGIGLLKDGWLCPADCACAAPTAAQMPVAWENNQRADVLVGAPDVPGGWVSNGYVGAWAPRGLAGSAGSPACGVEHVKVRATCCCRCWCH
jgi:hypothetical protein